jgi:hypothetical protein
MGLQRTIRDGDTKVLSHLDLWAVTEGFDGSTGAGSTLEFDSSELETVTPRSIPPCRKPFFSV